MNRLIATKTTPVMTIVIISVSSISPQLEASGVNHHGLHQWKTTAPTAISTSAIANAMRTPLPGNRRQGN